MKKITALLLIVVQLSLSAQLKPFNDKGSAYWGYKDVKTGKVVISPMYTTAFEFKDGFAIVEESNKIELINEEGFAVGSFKNARITQNAPVKMIYLNDSSAGVYTQDGNLQKEIRFKEAHKCPNYSSDFFVLKDGNKVGFFDMYKGLVLPMEYETQSFQWTFHWDGDLYFSEKDVFCLKHNGKWGIIDPRGSKVLPFEYDHLEVWDTLYGACKNGKCGVINIVRKEIIPFNYEVFLGRYQGSGRARTQDPFIFLDKGKIVFYRTDIKRVVDKVPSGQYDWERPAFVFVQDQQGKRGLVDSTGKILVPIEFEFINSLSGAWDQSNKLSVVCKDKKCGVYELGSGYKIQPFECQNIQVGSLNDKLYYIITKNMKYGLYDQDMKPITDCVYTYMSFMSDCLSVTKDEKDGKLFPSGEVKWDPVEGK